MGVCASRGFYCYFFLFVAQVTVVCSLFKMFRRQSNQPILNRNAALPSGFLRTVASLQRLPQKRVLQRHALGLRQLDDSFSLPLDSSLASSEDIFGGRGVYTSENIFGRGAYSRFANRERYLRDRRLRRRMVLGRGAYVSGQETLGMGPRHGGVVQNDSYVDQTASFVPYNVVGSDAQIVSGRGIYVNRKFLGF